MIAEADAPFDVAIVLGAAVSAGGRPSPALLRRVEHAVALFRQGHVDCLLMSGCGPGSTPEASVMCRIARAARVPAEAVLTEDQSRTTWENARFCKPIVEGRGWRRVLLVTERYHMRRALYAFRRFGIPVEAAAVPPASLDAALAVEHLREAAALAYYRWRFGSIS